MAKDVTFFYAEKLKYVFILICLSTDQAPGFMPRNFGSQFMAATARVAAVMEAMTLVAAES